LGDSSPPKLIPFRDPAGRVNLLSALAAAATVAVFYLVARRLAGSRTAAIISSIALAVSPVWWSQATIAEVYALHGLLLAAFLLFLLKWEEAVMLGRANDRYLVTAGLIFGLGLAHHRMIALLLPATLVFAFWTDPGLPGAAAWIKPAIAAIAPLLLHLYLPIAARRRPLWTAHTRDIAERWTGVLAPAIAYF
jgi:4-amino-4-deoxy-L-arabinose transferase-like glycosyltransferase